MLRLLLLLCSVALSTLCCVANNRAGKIVSVKSEGMTRRALVYAPQSQKSAAPLVFVFHGRGGDMHTVSQKIDIHNHWSEAIVVYPQGMWCEGGYRDGFGWVVSDTDDEGRDIRFFDVLLEFIEKNYSVDADNIFATGHSNGGGFTYALWAFRGDKFKGFAPSAAGTRRLGENAKKRMPKPVLIIGGSEDDVVRIEGIRREIEKVKQLNGCTEQSKFLKTATLYRGKGGADVAVVIHPSGHQFQSALVPEVVAFFKYVQKKQR
ncbi:MAG: prolyl oligopeptidase family serine peptidase [Alistipes sp.]|nr:prolyl oligopeptidase family serine peptidase [Alistipes sp.]